MPKGIRFERLPEVEPAHVGGDLAVDFLNTVGWRLDPARRNELLSTYRHLLAWMRQVELLSVEAGEELSRRAEREPELASHELDLAIELREDAYKVLDGGAEPKALRREIAAAHADGRLRREPGRAWTWVPAVLDLATPRRLLAFEFARLITSEAVVRFHRCEDRHCGWVFLDTSRQRNRRWCSAADCGNRNRVRAHYRRAASGGSPATR